MNKDRSVTRVIPTEIEQETTENDGGNTCLHVYLLIGALCITYTHLNV